MKICKVIAQEGTPHYTVDVQGTLIKRHVDQIRPLGNHVQNSYHSSPSYHWTPAPNSYIVEGPTSEIPVK